MKKFYQLISNIAEGLKPSLFDFEYHFNLTMLFLYDMLNSIQKWAEIKQLPKQYQENKKYANELIKLSQSEEGLKQFDTTSSITEARLNLENLLKEEESFDAKELEYRKIKKDIDNISFGDVFDGYK